MTVSELIAQLADIPGDRHVLIESSDEEYGPTVIRVVFGDEDGAVVLSHTLADETARHPSRTVLWSNPDQEP